MNSFNGYRISILVSYTLLGDEDTEIDKMPYLPFSYMFIHFKCGFCGPNSGPQQGLGC